MADIIIYWNAHSILSNLSEFKILLYTKKPAMAFISETWLSNKHSLNFINYSLIRQDRLLRRGGGILFLIRKDVIYKQITLNPYANGTLEALALVIHFDGFQCAILGIYNPAAKLFLCQELQSYISQLSVSKILIIGDFNAKHQTWSNGSQNSAGNALFSYLTSSPNICLLSTPFIATHIDVSTGHTTTLDICLGSPSFLNQINFSTGPDIGSDHLPVILCFKDNMSRIKCFFRCRWKIPKEANYTKYQQSLPPLSITGNLEVDNHYMVQSISAAASKAFKFSNGGFYNKPTKPWWTKECSEAIAHRRRAKRKLERTHSLTQYIEYKRLAARAKRIIKQAKFQSWKDYTEQLKIDTPQSQVWKMINGIRGRRHLSTYPLENAGASLVNPADKANYLNKFFYDSFNRQFVSTNAISKNKFIEDHINIPNDCLDKPFTFSEIILAMKNLPNKKASGVDNIPYELLKNLPTTYLQKLLKIFNHSWSQKVIPSQWKETIILPILKPGKDPTNCSSYRPISLISCLCKSFEKMVHTRLSYYLESNNLLSINQCGFRKGCSTLDQLVQLEHKIRLALSAKKTVIVLYIDFMGAFDGVPHLEVLHRLATLGVSGLMLGWLKNYLSDRTYKCFIQGSFSGFSPAESGVPQGSILSPTLFSVLINDIPSRQNNDLSAFADDVTFYLIAPSFSDAYDRMINVIHDLENWTKTSGMIINTEKSHYQYFSTKYIKDPPPLPYLNYQISYCKTYKFLGLIFDSPRLTFKDHIEELILDCTKRMNILKCVSSHSWGADRMTLTKFYVSFIRSRMDYGCQVYMSAAETHLHKLETVQNACLRIILGSMRSTRIDSLRVESFILPLSHRRELLSGLYYYKICYAPDNHPVVAKLLPSVQGLSFLHFRQPHLKPFILRARSMLTSLNLPIDYYNHQPIYSSLPPWNDCIIQVTTDLIIPVTKTDPVQLQKSAFLSTMEIKYNSFFAVYTDGSLVPAVNAETSVTAAFYIPLFQVSEAFRLPPSCSVCLAELYAILRSLQFIQDDVTRFCAASASFGFDGLVVCSDSQSALEMIKNCKLDDCGFVHAIYSTLNSLHTQYGLTIPLQWVPSHCDITGNDEADRLAQLAHSEIHKPIVNMPYPLNFLKRNLNESIIAKYNTQWQAIRSMTHLGLVKQKFESWNHVMPNERRSDVALSRLRLGHSRLKGHLFKLRLNENPNCILCSVEETPEHLLLHCPKYTQERDILRLSLLSFNVSVMDLRNLLGGGGFSPNITISIFRRLCIFLRQIGKFYEI